MIIFNEALEALEGLEAFRGPLADFSKVGDAILNIFFELDGCSFR